MNIENGIDRNGVTCLFEVVMNARSLRAVQTYNVMLGRLKLKRAIYTEVSTFPEAPAR